MVKKILGIFILLIIIIFFSIHVVVDKILIKKTITNIEKKLNLNIYLHEDYSFNIFPKLSLLTKFDLDKENFISIDLQLSLIKISNNLILFSANGTLSKAPGASNFL